MVALLLSSVLVEKVFDGRTLDGWEVVGGGRWTVEKGVLKGECTTKDEQGLLVYKRTVGDFRATFDFRISTGNSGFYFRTERIAEQPFVKGFQAEVDAIEDIAGIWETAGRGWIFKPDAALHAKTKFVPGKWAKMEVAAAGPHYVVRLNGQTVTDIVDEQGRRSGHLALQLHGGVDMTVEFRNIHVVFKN